MKKLLCSFAVLLLSLMAYSQCGNLYIAGVIDGPLTGATPKGIQVCASGAISDLSIYGIGSANNGGGTDGVEFTFPAIAISAGSCITLADSADVDRYMTFFGVMPTILVPGSVTGINGDDAMELFKDTVVVDVFGDINVDGSGQTWEYTDGWAYRKAATGPDGATFVESNWIFSGVDALQSDMDSVNTAFANPFPLCSYSPNPPAVIAAMDDSAVIEFDMADVLDILANDDIPNTLVSITITTMAANGAVVVNGLTDVTYTPTTGFCGTDSFVYEICDAASCSSATVNITVTCPINYVPYDIGLVTADSDGNGVGDSLGVAVELTGVVYGVDLQSNDNIQFFIIDGNNDGISLFSSNNFGYTVTEGDEVTVKGFISQFNGLTQIAPDELVVNSSANTLVTPTDVTSLGEDTESQLVRLLNVTLVDPWPTAPAPAGFNVNVTDGTNTYTIRIDDAVELYSMPAPVGVLNITGLGGQFDSSDPWTEGYQLLPRYAADIEEVVATVNPDLGNKIKMFPNPVNEVLQINAEIQLDNIRITNLLGQQVTEIRQPNLSESINVNNWKSGIYVITFMTGDEIWTSQFVKK